LKLAYVGLGSMGGPQARLIARHGFELAVYDPHPPARQAFEGLATLAASAADAATGAEVACVCVRDDAQVRDAVLGPDGLSRGLSEGSLVLIHSTVSIDLLHELAAALSPKGIALVDAPVSRTRRSDDDKFVFTMLGGDAGDVGRARTVVDAFSTGCEHMGPLGAGMAAKIANNLVTWVQIVVGAQAVDLAGHHGVAYDKLRAVLKSNGNLTPTMEQMLDGKDRAPPGGDATVDAFRASQAGIGGKDLALAVKAGAPVGMDMGLAAEARRALEAAMTAPLVRPRV
jgi:3-hydroxyisobutyrate dehydrogenase